MKDRATMELDLRGAPDQLPIDQQQSEAAGELFVQRFRHVWRVLPASVKKQIREVIKAEDAQRFDLQARHVLEVLNAKRGSRHPFLPVESNLRLIRARFAEGYSAEQLRAICAVKWRQVEAGEFPERYYRPGTLFRAEKCAQYVGELGGGR